METTPGKRIQMFREYKGYKKASAFAEVAGLKPATLSSIETDRTAPSFDSIASISAAFPDLSLDWLMLGTGSMLRGGKELTPLEAPARTAAPTTTVPIGNESELLKEVRQSRDKAYELLDQKQQEIDRAWGEADRYRDLYHTMLFNTDHPADAPGHAGKDDRSQDAAPLLSIAADTRTVVKGLLNSFQLQQLANEHAQQVAAKGVVMFVEKSGSATVHEGLREAV